MSTHCIWPCMLTWCIIPRTLAANWSQWHRGVGLAARAPQRKIEWPHNVDDTRCKAQQRPKIGQKLWQVSTLKSRQSTRMHSQGKQPRKKYGKSSQNTQYEKSQVHKIRSVALSQHKWGSKSNLPFIQCRSAPHPSDVQIRTLPLLPFDTNCVRNITFSSFGFVSNRLFHFVCLVWCLCLSR